jgi:hypothetical protein
MGYLLNEEFIGFLGETAEAIGKSSYLQMMRELNDAFKSNMHRASPLLFQYLSHLTPCIDLWCEALDD